MTGAGLLRPALQNLRHGRAVPLRIQIQLLGDNDRAVPATRGLDGDLHQAFWA